jgi:hypothetical protein
MRTMLTFVVLVAAACGGKKTPATSGPTGTGAGATATSGAGEHANMGPEMTRFHDVLAPRWHADKGDKRKADTCASVPDFKSNAAALANSAPPPSAEAASWSTATQELTVAVGGLEAACASSPNDFEAAFERVHTIFHAVMELGEAKGDHAGGEHSGHKM